MNDGALQITKERDAMREKGKVLSVSALSHQRAHHRAQAQGVKLKKLTQVHDNDAHIHTHRQRERESPRTW